MSKKLYRKTTKNNQPKLDELAAFNSDCTFSDSAVLGYDASDASIKPLTSIDNFEVNNLTVHCNTTLEGPVTACCCITAPSATITDLSATNITNSCTITTENVDVCNCVNVACDVNIGGNLYVCGTEYITDIEQVKSCCDKILLRDGAVSGLAVGCLSGIEVNKYDGTNNTCVGVDNCGTLRVGDAGTCLEPVFTRDEAIDMNSQGLVYWDCAGSKAKTISLPTCNGQILTACVSSTTMPVVLLSGPDNTKICADNMQQFNGTATLSPYGEQSISGFLWAVKRSCITCPIPPEWNDCEYIYVMPFAHGHDLAEVGCYTYNIAGTPECQYLTNICACLTGIVVSDDSSEHYCDAVSQMSMQSNYEFISYIAAYTTSSASTIDYCWEDKTEIANCVEISEVCQNLNYKVPFTCNCEVLTACSKNMLYNPNTGTLTVDHVCSCDISLDEIKADKLCDLGQTCICYCSSAKAQDDAAVVMHAYRCTIDSNNPLESYATLGYDGFYLTCVPFCQRDVSQSGAFTCAVIGNGCNIWETQVCSTDCTRAYRCGSYNGLCEGVKAVDGNGCLLCGGWAQVGLGNYERTIKKCVSNTNYTCTAVISDCRNFTIESIHRDGTNNYLSNLSLTPSSVSMLTSCGSFVLNGDGSLNSCCGLIVSCPSGGSFATSLTNAALSICNTPDATKVWTPMLAQLSNCGIWTLGIHCDSPSEWRIVNTCTGCTFTLQPNGSFTAPTEIRSNIWISTDSNVSIYQNPTPNLCCEICVHADYVCFDSSLVFCSACTDELCACNYIETEDLCVCSTLYTKYICFYS